jgi:hypothetical protein
MTVQSNIGQHALIEMGMASDLHRKGIMGKLKKHIYVMVSSTNLSLHHLSCYIVHKLGYAAGQLKHLGLRSEGIFTTEYASDTAKSFSVA